MLPAFVRRLKYMSIRERSPDKSMRSANLHRERREATSGHSITDPALLAQRPLPAPPGIKHWLQNMSIHVSALFICKFLNNYTQLPTTAELQRRGLGNINRTPPTCHMRPYSCTFLH